MSEPSPPKPPSPLRQLLNEGWNDNWRQGLNAQPIRSGPNQGFPLRLPRGGSVDEETVFRLRRLKPPPPPPMTDDQLRASLQRDIRSIEHQLKTIEPGWQDRVARRLQRGVNKKLWPELDTLKPELRGRLDDLNRQLGDLRRSSPNMNETLSGRPPDSASLTPRVSLVRPLPGGGGPPVVPPSGGTSTATTAIKTGIVGELLIGFEGAGLWIANRLPVGGGLMTRAVLGSSGLIYGAANWIYGTLVAIITAPIVVKGVIIAGALVIIGGAIYYMLPDGTLISLDEEPRYAVVKQTTAGFDGGDIHLVPMERDEVDEFVEARSASTGQQVTVMLGPFDTETEATNALCNSIVPGSLRVENGVRMARFSFGGHFGLPRNPCPDETREDDDD